MDKTFEKGDIVHHKTRPDMKMIYIGNKEGEYNSNVDVVRFYCTVNGWKVQFFDHYELEKEA